MSRMIAATGSREACDPEALTEERFDVSRRKWFQAEMLGFRGIDERRVLSWWRLKKRTSRQHEEKRLDITARETCESPGGRVKPVAVLNE